MIKKSEWKKWSAFIKEHSIANMMPEIPEVYRQLVHLAAACAHFSDATELHIDTGPDNLKMAGPGVQNFIDYIYTDWCRWYSEEYRKVFGND